MIRNLPEAAPFEVSGLGASGRSAKTLNERQRAVMLKPILAAAVLSLYAGAALAAGSCADQAAGRKLAGAAKSSFMIKCEKGATASCDSAAGAKKLAGAAKTSFLKKCVSDAVGQK